MVVDGPWYVGVHSSLNVLHNDMAKVFSTHIYVLRAVKEINNGADFTLCKEDVEAFGRRLWSVVDMSTDLDWLAM